MRVPWPAAMTTTWTGVVDKGGLFGRGPAPFYKGVPGDRGILAA